MIALSSLHETIFYPTNSNGHTATAVYKQAVRAIIKSDMSYPLESILMSCMLFVCREFLNGQSRIAMLHYEAGAKIFEEWRASQAQTHSPSIIQERMAPIFRGFLARADLYDLSQTNWTMSPPNFLDDPVSFEMPVIPDIMPSLNDARWSLDGMFLWVVSAMASENTDVHSIHIPAVRNMVAQWLVSFEKGKIQPQLKSAGAIHCALLLQVHHLIATIIVNAFPYETETVFDQFIDEFRTVVLSMEPLVLQEVACIDPAKDPSETHYHLHQGYIPPLFFTATRCRDPRVRRHALSLLRILNRSEGGWNSCIAAKIAEHVIDREGHGLTGVQRSWHVPESSRVRLYSAALGSAATDHVLLRFRRFPYKGTIVSFEQDQILWQSCDSPDTIAWVGLLFRRIYRSPYYLRSELLIQHTQPIQRVLQVAGYNGVLIPVPGNCRCARRNHRFDVYVSPHSRDGILAYPILKN